MKIIFIYVLLVATIAAQGQTKNVLINSHAFQIKNMSEENESAHELVKKIELHKAKTKLLTHTINNISGDCNSSTVELGSYETTDSTIIFYSYWARAGDAPVSPYGVRKQIYEVSANGNLALKYAEMYIETSRKGWEENKGIEYLFKKPKNEFERKQLKEYIKETEKEYNASFVFGERADSLFREVRGKLKTQIRAKTKSWKALYSNRFGYKM